MQKISTTIALLFSLYANSQICTIDYSQTQTGIYPDTLPTGNVGLPYNTDITFVMPLDTLGYDFTNFYILSVSLPVGLNWECNNTANNCNYNPQVSQHGCANISGTPLLAGTYTIDVTVLADLTVIQGYPFTFQVFLEILPNNVITSNNGFTMVGASGCSPITVDFINNNPGELAYWWDFGNGNISSVENPVPQVYNVPGDYLVQYKAWDNLDTVDVYTFTNVTINSMSNFGGGFPSYETPDAYFILKENNVNIYQSNILGDQSPPVNWSTSIILNPSFTYVIEIWDADESFGEVILGADDFMGSHTLNITGCNGCGAGTSNINYAINHQIIYPNPIVISEDTIHVYGYPTTPIIQYNSTTHILNTLDLGFNYQWYFNESPISGATDVTYQVSQSGVYHVIAINETGCVSFSDTLTAVYCNPAILPTINIPSDGLLVASNIPNGYSIQWIFNDFPINGQTNDSISALLSGAYTVEIIDTFGCVYYSSAFTVSAGLDEVETVNWTIYPNPAQNSVQVEVKQNIEFDRIELVDVTGRSIKVWQWDATSTIQLDISDVPDGYFLLQMVKGNRTWPKQLIVN
jgi:hypothetical protein